ncbi:dihydrofolate reductase [Planococcus versutus]|uniref:Dihydrofolate reductase n=1 Tax=Planococcus versutus TaxID=1302659 RepID=A0A1B1S4V0_9BACL|nr:dihydrofolate reductase [Planococcus versutus]ANU28221.1 dihydrofolate reductase [Planococcus versutus]
MISMMVAHDLNRVIGKNNELPWHIPADLAYFKEHTIGKGIVMGRNTFESIGRPLPKRRNIVVTRNDDYTADGVNVVHNIQDAIKLAREKHEEIMIIGGEQVFESVLPDADRLYITLVQHEYNGDTYFPEYGREWKLVSESEQQTSNDVTFSYLVYERRKKKNDRV